jgi:hypothetical protein
VIDKALESGVAVLVTRNHGHFGAAGLYSRLTLPTTCSATSPPATSCTCNPATRCTPPPAARRCRSAHQPPPNRRWCWISGRCTTSTKSHPGSCSQTWHRDSSTAASGWA